MNQTLYFNSVLAVNKKKLNFFKIIYLNFFYLHTTWTTATLITQIIVDLLKRRFTNNDIPMNFVENILHRRVSEYGCTIFVINMAAREEV